jgi:hypothetical protein
MSVDKKTRVALLEKAALFGDSEAQHRLGQYYETIPEQSEAEAFKWHLRAAEQYHHESSGILALSYEKGRGCALDLVLSARYFVRFGECDLVEERLKTFIRNKQSQLQILFEFGRGFKMDSKLRAFVGKKETAPALEVYEQSSEAAQKATFCFLWICKQGPRYYLIRDMQKFIGRMIWQSREDPILWIGREADTTAKLSGFFRRLSFRGK